MDIATRDALAAAILPPRSHKEGGKGVSGYFQKAVLWQLWAMESDRHFVSVPKLANILQCDNSSVYICIALLVRHGYLIREDVPSKLDRRFKRSLYGRRYRISLSRLTSSSSSTSLSSVSPPPLSAKDSA